MAAVYDDFDCGHQVEQEETVYYQINWFPARKDWEWSVFKPGRTFNIGHPSLCLESIRRFGPLEIRKLRKKPAEQNYWRPPIEKTEGHPVQMIRPEISEEEIRSKIASRGVARAIQLWDLADSIRDDLCRAGVILEDVPGGTRWRWKGQYENCP